MASRQLVMVLAAARQGSLPADVAGASGAYSAGMMGGGMGSAPLLIMAAPRVAACELSGWDTGGQGGCAGGAGGAVGAVPGICDSQGLLAGGLLLLFCSDVSHSMLTVPGIPDAPRPSTSIVVAVSRGAWTLGPTGGSHSMELGG